MVVFSLPLLSTGAARSLKWRVPCYPSRVPDTSSSPRLLWRRLAYAALALAFAFFCWRGLGRALSNSYDLGVVYASAAAWQDGGNPYLAADCAAAMKARGGTPEVSAVALYPPCALAALSPLAWLDWPTARMAWLMIQCLAVWFLFLALRRLEGSALRDGWGGWLLAMVFLLWAPLHTGLAVGQVALPVAALMVWALVSAEAGHRLVSGLLLGLALAIKPQLGLFFLPVLLWRKQWGASLFALVVLATLSGVGGGRLEWTSDGWRQQWLDNLQAFAHGGVGDVFLPWARAQMIQFATLPASVGRADAVMWGYGFAALAGCGWLLIQWRSRVTLSVFAVASALSLLALLAGYHRSYDAVLALVPMAYGLLRVAESKRSAVGWSLVAALAAFLTPGGAGLMQAFPLAATGGPWWLQYQTLALLAALAVLTMEVCAPARAAA